MGTLAEAVAIIEAGTACRAGLRRRGGLPRVGLPRSRAMVNSEAQRRTLVDSLRLRWCQAVRDGDAPAKQALFKEAVYLGIRPGEFADGI